jgi:hypothetical protein
MRSVHEFLLKELSISCCVNVMDSTGCVKRELTSTMLPLFFKSSRNSNDASPLVILPKFITMSSFEASLNGSTVESNLKSRCSNPIVQLVCSNDLLTFILVVVLDLFEILVLPN